MSSSSFETSQRQFGLPFYNNDYGTTVASIARASSSADAAKAALNRLDDALAPSNDRPTTLLTLGAVSASPRFQTK